MAALRVDGLQIERALSMGEAVLGNICDIIAPQHVPVDIRLAGWGGAIQPSNSYLSNKVLAARAPLRSIEFIDAANNVSQ